MSLVTRHRPSTPHRQNLSRLRLPWQLFRLQGQPPLEIHTPLLLLRSLQDFHRSKAIFSVKTGLRTLLRDFNASVNADTSDPPSGAITREFCVYAEGNGVKLNLTFTPTNQDSYAFINGIEIVSMPDDLYYTPPNPNDHGGRGLKLVNMDKRLLPVENNTALELILGSLTCFVFISASFEDDITAAGDRVFLIYIRDYTAEPQFDVFRRAGGKYSPIYEDYAVLVPGGNQKKVNLSVTLQPNPEDFKTRYANVILNGIEIFKLNDSNGNLGGQNPDPPITTVIQSPPPSIPPKKNSGKTVAVVIPVVIVGVVAILALALFFFRRRRTFADQTSSDGASWLALYSTSTNKSNKSSKTRNSNLPSNICRYFSLPEIQAATKNFDDNFIIGVGGFGTYTKATSTTMPPKWQLND
ncbi:Receptor-like protein kinase FERONIA, partial [Cucurbita argyrosperma subsp. sororia]